MITGGCLCGAVRFKATEAPITARVCWCRDCQKIGAGGPTANAAFRTGTLTVEGALKDYASIADSGNRMHRKFCPSCGTHLFSEAEFAAAPGLRAAWRPRRSRGRETGGDDLDRLGTELGLHRQHPVANPGPATAGVMQAPARERPA